MLHLPLPAARPPVPLGRRGARRRLRTREPFVEVSQANAGLMRRDLSEPSQQAMRASLPELPMRELVALSARAADCFAGATLPLGDATQTPEDYVRQLSATTGLPARHGPQEHGEDPRRSGDCEA